MKNITKLSQKLKLINSHLIKWGVEKIDLSEALFYGLVDYFNETQILRLANDIYKEKTSLELFEEHKREIQNTFN